MKNLELARKKKQHHTVQYTVGRKEWAYQGIDSKYSQGARSSCHTPLRLVNQTIKLARNIESHESTYGFVIQ